MNGSTPGFPVSQSVLKLMSVESVIQPSNHVILCHPLLLLPSIFPSIRVISNELACHIRWSKYWGFSFSISPSSEYSVLIFFRMDWFDLVAVENSQQFSPASQFKTISSLALSLVYGPNLTSIHDFWEKRIALSTGPFVNKVMSLPFICCLGLS